MIEVDGLIKLRKSTNYGKDRIDDCRLSQWLDSILCPPAALKKPVSTIKPRQRILSVTAVPLTVRAFLLPYIEQLSREFEVTVACSDDEVGFHDRLPQGVAFLALPIAREISPFRDLMALLRLTWILFTRHFDLVHSVTPKAGLIAQMAAKVAGVPVRVHMFTGQVWVTRRGWMRRLLKGLDRLTASCATHLLTDSASQLHFLVAEKIVASQKIKVLAQGSISGVNLARFHPDAVKRRSVRAQLGYDDQDIVSLFVGRLNRDKGILDLASAFVAVHARVPKLVLLIVGPDEENLTPEIERLAQGKFPLRLVGSTSRPEDFMAAADFFCLPSYREGFGSVVIEAAACGIPAIVSEIYGLTDAVENERSGIMHAPRDIASIERALERMASDEQERLRMGRYAFDRARKYFSEEAVVGGQVAFIKQTLADGQA